MSRLVLIFALFVLISCKEISFREPQPKGRKALASIPKSLQGKYLSLKEENGEFSKDTIVIYSTGYRFGYFDPIERAKKGDLDKGTLGDSLVLKSYKGYYFMNMNQKPEWMLRVLKQQKNGDLLYM